MAVHLRPHRIRPLHFQLLRARPAQIRALPPRKRCAWAVAVGCAVGLACAVALASTGGARAADNEQSLPPGPEPGAGAPGEQALIGPPPKPAPLNDQTIVAGVGAGLHTFWRADDVRKASPLYGGQEIESALAGELYVEWYALGTLGFGVRTIGLLASRSSAAAAPQADERISATLEFVTVNWVPFGATSYARLGLIGGAGVAQYTASLSASGYEHAKGSSDGSAGLLGVYLDWGAEDFGARLGVHSVATSMQDMKLAGVRSSVDASGTTLYFDLRWAW